MTVTTESESLPSVDYTNGVLVVRHAPECGDLLEDETVCNCGGDVMGLHRLGEEIKSLRSELEAARRDTARIDALERIALDRNVVASGIEPNSDTPMFSVGVDRNGGTDDFDGYGLRECIDALIEANPTAASRALGEEDTAR